MHHASGASRVIDCNREGFRAVFPASKHQGRRTMAFSLYDASVANYLQILGAVGGYLDKSLGFFREKGIDPAEVVEARLASDMWPLRWQIGSLVHHSRGAMEATKTGVFLPPSGKPDLDYAALQAL